MVNVTSGEFPDGYFFHVIPRLDGRHLAVGDDIVRSHNSIRCRTYRIKPQE